MMIFMLKKQRVSLFLGVIMLINLVGCLSSQQAENTSEPSQQTENVSETTDGSEVDLDQEGGWIEHTSSRYGYAISYPPHWTLIENATVEQLQLDHISGRWGPQNDVFVSEDGCVISFGFGAGHGPSNELTNEMTEINGSSFTRRTWFDNGTPFFRAYLQDSGANLDFETLHVWFAPNALETCMQDVESILEEVQFSPDSSS